MDAEKQSKTHRFTKNFKRLKKMKLFEEAKQVDGVKVCSSQTEIVCSHCQDPVSQHEEQTGVCTNCSQPWKPKQSVAVWATSVKAGVRTWGQ